MPSPNPERPPVVLDQALDAAAIQRFVLDRLAPHLEGYLYQQRWFGDKDRSLAGVSLADVAVDAADHGWFVLAVATVRFSDGSAPADYLLLAAVIPDTGWSDTTLVRLAAPDGDWQFADIAAAPAFPTWWLRKFAVGEPLAGRRGRFSWQRFPGFAEAATVAGPGKLILGGMGQSNTTIRYADAMFGKIFRRMREGINPDEEISRALAEQTDFRQLPIPYGSASYQAAEGTTYPVGVLFSFVPSVDEGWEWTQRFLAEVPLPSYAEPARGLGERTGQLHLALASVVSDPAFAPEPVSAADIAEWQRQTSAAVRAIAADLQTRAPIWRRGHGRWWTLCSTSRTSSWTGWLASKRWPAPSRPGFTAITTLARYCEPRTTIGCCSTSRGSRPARSRSVRAKTAPMKDVADMLRSFGYARGMAARSPGADHDRLLAWEDEARQAFLAGYRAVVTPAPAPLVPADDADFTAAVAAWELAKAIYEVRYELGNRPDWLEVPLRTLLARD